MNILHNIIARQVELTFNRCIKIGQRLFDKIGAFESFLIDCSKESGTVYKAIKEQPWLTRIFCYYIRKISMNRHMTKEMCFKTFEEYLILTKAAKTLDTEDLTTMLNGHQNEYYDLSYYIYTHTGCNIKFIYNPVILQSIRSGVCAVFNIEIDDAYIVFYDDIFKVLSDIDQRCFGLHEAGHMFYKHLQSGGSKVHNIELEADDYAAFIVGKKNMRDALLHVAAKYPFFRKMCFKREIIERMRELN